MISNTGIHLKRTAVPDDEFLVKLWTVLCCDSCCFRGDILLHVSTKASGERTSMWKSADRRMQMILVFVQ